VPRGRPPLPPLGHCPETCPGPRRRGLCSAHYQAHLRGPSSRRAAGLVLLSAPRVTPTVAGVLNGVAERRGVTPYALLCEVLERWAEEQIEEGSEP
jgi:hypothetical protein